MKTRDIRIYGSSSMPEDDSIIGVGGSIDRTVMIGTSDLSQPSKVQLVSSSVDDAGLPVVIEGRGVDGVLVSETLLINGVTPVVSNTTFRRLLSVTKPVTQGYVAVEQINDRRTMSVVAADADSITLDPSAQEDYTGKILRIDSGAAAGLISRIVQYSIADQIAYVASQLSTVPDQSSIYVVSNGLYLEPTALKVVNPLKNSASDVPAGITKRYCTKIFFTNDGSDVLRQAFITQVTNSSYVSFALDDQCNGDLLTNNTRQVPPSGLVFDSEDKEVPGGMLLPHSAIGVWILMDLPPGIDPATITYTIACIGID